MSIEKAFFLQIVPKCHVAQSFKRASSGALRSKDISKSWLLLFNREKHGSWKAKGEGGGGEGWEEGKGTRVKEARYIKSNHVKLIYSHIGHITACNNAI